MTQTTESTQKHLAMIHQHYIKKKAQKLQELNHRQSETHYWKLFSVVTLLQFLSLGWRHSSSPRLSLLPLLTNTLPGPSASEVTTLWCYTNLFIIVMINISFPDRPSVLWCCWLGGRKGIRPVKNWAVKCWHGYLSGARCRLAYGPADATATHCFLLQ